MPNLHVLTTSCVCLEPRPLPSAGVTRFPRYYGPLRHPKAPGTSLTSFRLLIPEHAEGLPVLRALSLCTCCRHYPGAASAAPTLLISTAVSAFPSMAAGSACTMAFRGLLSVHSRYGLHTRTVTTFCDSLAEGFSHFVTSMTAPVTSGWSISPGGILTHWKAPPLHGARQSGHWTIDRCRAATWR